MTNVIDLPAKLDELKGITQTKRAEFEAVLDIVSTAAPQVPELARALMERELTVILANLNAVETAFTGVTAAANRLHALVDLYGSAHS